MKANQFWVFALLLVIGKSLHVYLHPRITRDYIHPDTALTLQELAFTQCRFAPDGINMISDLEFPKLKRLLLDRLSLNLEQLKEVLKIKAPILEQLDFSNTHIGGEGFSLLVKSGWIQKVKILGLSWGGIMETQMKQIEGLVLDNLQKLDLSNNRLSREGYQSLSKSLLPNIKSLHLQTTYLFFDAMDFFSKMNISTLEQLVLMDSSFGPQQLTQLSQMNLPNLKKLSFSYLNFRTSFSNTFQQMNLQKLELFMCQSCRIDKEVEFNLIKMPNLKGLYLDNNLIKQLVPEILQKPPSSLQVLSLSGNHMRSFKSLESLPISLKGLILSNNMLNNQDIGILHKFTNLELLRLDKNQIDDEGIAQLFSQPFCKLKALDISRLSIGEKAMRAMGKMDWSQLRVIDLEKNQLGSNIVHMGKSINFPKLTALKLSQSWMNDEGLSYIFREWNIPSLEKILLQHNHITDQSLIEMSKVNLDNLRILDLSRSKKKLTGQGFKAFSPSSLKNLEQLILNGNQFTLEGAKALARLNLPSLKKLYMQNTNLSSQALKELSKLNIPNVGIVKFDYNPIDDEGGKYFFNRSRSNLSVIQIHHTYVSDLTVQAITFSSPYLENLYLQQTNITSNLIEKCNDIFFDNLRLLQMRRNELDDRFAEALFKKSKLPKLRLLDLSLNDFTNVGMQWLSLIPFESLRTLIIYQNSYANENGYIKLLDRQYPVLFLMSIRKYNVLTEETLAKYAYGLRYILL